MTIKECINVASKSINYINSKILMKYVLKKDDSYIIINSKKILDKNIESKYLGLVKKVEKGYPLQYITNKQYFMENEIFVDENVLIPQPDTEVLVQKAIEYIKSKKKAKVLDLCTGSGAIAISIKKEVKDAQVFASDISMKALNIAKKNAKNNNVNIKFIKSNMFENIKDKFDVIVSNPPYIKTSEIEKLPEDVKKEPTIALDGGEDGLLYYKIISKDINKYLNKEGVLLLEIGYNQKKEVEKLLKGSICIKDYENRDRVIIWELSQKK